uniref:Uncharacterized protein n=2 Tax=Candidatus Bipolaricaulota TaxID=67810 RepID=H5SMN8_9BACT|nr:hypothetical protein HGMM_F50D11C33 [uncultured Acetothermia bacterium]BAL59806.1 hypothetical protein HGMM_OP4C442 [Candidatus Acetothermum autotrophicum]
MPRKVFWGLLAGAVVLTSIWHLQTQLNYRAFVHLAQGLRLSVADAALEETPERVRVRFTVVLTNSTERAIPVEGTSCLLYAGQEFLGPCVISSDAPAVVPPQGEWRIDVITEITGHYLENYRKVEADGVRVQGSVQIALPLGSDSIKAMRRFSELIPKR